jgi:hypothetical protein
MSFRRVLEMSISREDFLRLVAAALPGYEVEGETVSWSHQGGRGTIGLLRLPDARLGPLAVPRHAVTIEIHGCSEVQGEEFIDGFRRAFMRGGG